MPRTGVPVPALARHGLSVHADLVYRYLYMFGEEEPVKLSAALGLAPGQTGPALEELAACGAVSSDRRRRKWRAHEPAAFLGALRERRARLAIARRGLVRNLSMADITGVRAEDLTGAAPMVDLSRAVGRFDEVITNATDEFLAMNPEVAFSAASIRSAAPRDRSALANGVHARSLGVPAAEEDESHEYASELAAYDVAYRESPQLRLKLWIVDRRTAFFPMDPSANFRSGVWEISEPAVVAELVGFFERGWDEAAPQPAGWRPPQGLTDRERAVLAALVQGDTDDAVARRLRLSSRTVRYVIRDLMDRYQVQTRFQLGLAVGRLTEGADR